MKGVAAAPWFAQPFDPDYATPWEIEDSDRLTWHPYELTSLETFCEGKA